MKLILDTDIGDDIDDAFALATLLSSPEVELAGVTTVFRNTRKRAQLAAELISAAGKRVPVYAGETTPEREEFHRFAKDGDGAPEESSPCQWCEDYAGHSAEEKDAVTFLAESAERYGEELTVLAIGPLSNVAQAIKRYPGQMAKLGKIVLMGGRFFEEGPEWNILCDPEAADTVLKSGIPVYAVGLDVTLQCTLESDLLEAFASSDKPVNKLLTLWLGRWKKFFNFEKSVMHDPLAAAVCLAPVCGFRRIYGRADLTNVRGAISVSEVPMSGFTPIFAAETVDKEAFYKLVRERLL